MDIQEWNAIVYKNDDGSFTEGNLLAKAFWEEFGIKSYPLFKDKCYYHIPAKWADDVRLMIKQIQSELGDRIEFQQIKESWCQLIVYRSAKDKEAENRCREIIAECINRLKEKGLHPSEND